MERLKDWKADQNRFSPGTLLETEVCSDFGFIEAALVFSKKSEVAEFIFRSENTEAKPQLESKVRTLWNLRMQTHYTQCEIFETLQSLHVEAIFFIFQFQFTNLDRRLLKAVSGHVTILTLGHLARRNSYSWNLCL